MAATDSGFSEYLPLVRPLDEEQARLVEILVAARGSEVSFEQLRRQGIENPAVLAYELEIAGLPISHVQGRAGGRASAVGLRLDATLPLEVPPQESSRNREALQENAASGASGTRNGGGRRRAAAPRPPRELWSWIATGVAALVLIIIVVALVSGTGSGHGKGPNTGSALTGSAANHSGQPSSASVTAAPASAGAGAGKAFHHARRATPAAPPPAPLSHAAQLQQAGHVLLAEGRYAAAIPELRAAISAGGESAAGCSEPTTPGCVAYAEALYDLGRALRLDNANAAAGAVLQERLRIDSQRSAVQHEIGLNRHRRTSAPASRQPAHSKTPHTNPTPTTTPTGKPKQTPSPAPTAHPITGGAAAPSP